METPTTRETKSVDMANKLEVPNPLLPDDHHAAGHKETRNSTRQDFEWLEDLNSDCSTALNWSFPAKTSDFGSEGYTGSVTDFWHDMLQLTAPDEACGVVYVRGDFPDDPGSVLARAQTYLQNRSWGLRLDTKSYKSKDFPIAQSLINHRWPYTQYPLKIRGYETGTYTICSFVKDATVYQVARLKLGEIITKDLQGSSSKQQDRLTVNRRNSATTIPMKFILGGNIRFGCVCSLGQRQGDEYTLSASEDGLQHSCTSSRYGKKLTMQIFSDGEEINIENPNSTVAPPESAADPNIDAPDDHPSWTQKWTKMAISRVENVRPDKPTVIVAAFSLRSAEDNTPLTPMSSAEVEEYLGVSESSIQATKRLWDACKTSKNDAVEFRDITAIARSFEIVSNVSSIPMKAYSRQDLESIKIKNIQDSSPTNESDHEPVLTTQSSVVTENKTKSRDGMQPKASGESSEAPPDHINDVVASVEVKDASGQEISHANPEVIPHSPILQPPTPTTDENLQSTNSSSTDVYLDILQESPIALIDNLVSSLEVNLGSFFWQLRLLIKVYHFLGSQSFARDISKDNPLATIYQEYNQRILRNIRGALIWLLRAPLEHGPPLTPANMQDSSQSQRPECQPKAIYNQGVNIQACWVTIAVWYAFKHCWEAAAPVLRNKTLNLQIVKLANIGVYLASSKHQEIEHAFLQWHHYSCLINLFGKIQELDYSKIKDLERQVGRVGRVEVELGEEKKYTEEVYRRFADTFGVRDLETKAKKSEGKIQGIVNPTKKARSHKFSPQQELEDRLALISKELHSDYEPPTLPENCVKFVQERINSRSSTVEINPGSNIWEDPTTETPTDSPWELTFLNHHTALQVSSLSDDESKMEANKDACYQFSMSDYTFIPTWDEGNNNMIGSWWNVEVNSVLCSTLIDLQTLARNNDFKDDERNAALLRGFRAGLAEAESLQSRHLVDIVQDPQPAEPESGPFTTRIQVPTGVRNTETKPYSWFEARPDLIYYPNAWIQSLDDTPKKLFHKKQTKNLSLRKRIKEYISKKDRKMKLQPPKWDMDNVVDEIPPQDLIFLSTFDLIQEDDSFSLVISGRADQNQVRVFLDPDGEESYFGINSDSDDEVDDVREKDQSLQVWSTLLGPHDVEPSSLEKVLAREKAAKVGDGIQRKKFSRLYQQLLFNKLNDSMVDCRVKYRVLYAERCCPTQVAAFMYMWHPDGIDGFDDYFGTISRFSETLNQTWTTTINISYWGFLPINNPDSADKEFDELPEYMKESFDEDRTHGSFPPPHVLADSRIMPRIISYGFLDSLIATWRKLTKKNSSSPKGETRGEDMGLDKKQLRVEERSSCLVITGDNTGRFWKCSVWSSLINEKMMAAYMTRVSDIVQLFIHQQPVGRSIVFIYLLGCICEKLSDEYKFFIDRLEDFVKLGQKVFLYGDGLDLEGDGAVFQLKQMLWGLEALRILEAKLRSSTTEIRRSFDAATEMARSQPGHRRPELNREFRVIIEDFKKQQESLEDYQSIIKLKIEQLTGLRDGTSTVTNMIDAHQAARDSQTAIKQGNNIRVLTLLTIIYLPLGFVSGLFQMGHGIISNNAGSHLFAGLIFVFLFVTLGVAPYLIQAFDGIWEGARATQAERRKEVKIAKVNDMGQSTAGNSPPLKNESFMTHLKNSLHRKIHHEQQPQNVIEVPVMLTNGMGNEYSTSRDARLPSFEISSVV